MSTHVPRASSVTSRSLVVACLAAPFVSVPAGAEVTLSDGDFDNLPVSSAPDVGLPAGAWQWPQHYVDADLIESNSSIISVVPTSSFDPGATGNSLAFNASQPPRSFPHLPNLFGSTLSATPGQIAVVTCDVWVAPNDESLKFGGGTIYLGSDQGSGGYTNTSDRTAQVSLLPTGSLAYTRSDGQLTILPVTYAKGEWNTLRIDIDLNTLSYDLFFAPRGDPLAFVADDLPFRSPADQIDRLTIAHFREYHKYLFAYYDNFTFNVVPAPGATMVLAAGVVMTLGRRRPHERI